MIPPHPDFKKERRSQMTKEELRDYRRRLKLEPVSKKGTTR